MRWFAMIALVGCGSQVESAPIDVRVDTYNVGLAGIGVPLEAARRPALLAELAKLDGDFVCLQEVWQESDKLAVRDAMKAHYPYAHYAKTSLQPSFRATAPCAGQETQLNEGVACLTSNRATSDGHVTSLGCAVDNCVGSVASLLGAPDKSCYACLAATIPSEKIADIGVECSKPGPGYSFAGQSSVMLLSKHPLAVTEVHPLAGCWQKRVSISATATLPNGASVEISCNHLSSIDDDELIPYVCPWGDGTTGKTAWEAEQLAQAKTVLGGLRGKSTIVLGDFNATPDTYGQKTLAMFAGFTDAPLNKCTFCADNPLTDGDENGWLDHIFVRGGTVKSTSRTFDVPTVSADGKTWPMSDHYGARAVITIR